MYRRSDTGEEDAAGWSKGAIGLLLKQVCEEQAKQGSTLVCLLAVLALWAMSSVTSTTKG